MLIVKFRGLIDKIIQVLSTIIMGVMVIAVCWQVITRYILNNPSTVTEEALRYLLIWVTMVGGAYAYGRRKHLAITALSKRLSFKGQKILDIFVQAMVILFCVVVMIGGGTRPVNNPAAAQYRCGSAERCAAAAHAPDLRQRPCGCHPVHLLRAHLHR